MRGIVNLASQQLSVAPGAIGGVVVVVGVVDTYSDVVPRVGWGRGLGGGRQAGVGGPVGPEARAFSEQVRGKAHHQPVALRLDGRRQLGATEWTWTGSKEKGQHNDGEMKPSCQQWRGQTVFKHRLALSH